MRREWVQCGFAEVRPLAVLGRQVTHPQLPSHLTSTG
jgi:hypothetical protein